VVLDHQRAFRRLSGIDDLGRLFRRQDHLVGLRGDRQWKNYQQKFYALEKKRLAFDAQAAEVKANEAGLGKLQDDLKAAREQLASKKDEEAKLQDEVNRVQVESSFITRQFTMGKATRDQYRSFYERRSNATT